MAYMGLGYLVMRKKQDGNHSTWLTSKTLWKMRGVLALMRL